LVRFFINEKNERSYANVPIIDLKSRMFE